MGDAWRIVMRRTGGPEVLEREDFDPPVPGPGEVLIAQEAIGLNFIDTYLRSGLYPLALPGTPGGEAAGHVVEAGPDVSGFAPGDRVGYFSGPPGAYATHRVVAADRLVKLPDWLPTDQAAAILLKGCTVEMLVERCARVKAGQWVLVHAAAGGVGSLLVPWLKAVGAQVIAHAGTAEKAERTKAAGADVALSCPMDELAGAVRAGTGGAGVATVFDGVGKASWSASLASLAKTGLLVSFGNASGTAESFSVMDLMRGGSLFVTRPTLGDYVATPKMLAWSSARLFEMIEKGTINPLISNRFPLADVEEAHRALEARQTTGLTVLIP
ncbi:MAG TPA: quinone oxidoreductase [Sphingomonas sp.]